MQRTGVRKQNSSFLLGTKKMASRGRAASARHSTILARHGMALATTFAEVIWLLAHDLPLLPSRLLAASRRWNNYRHLLPGLSGEAYRMREILE